MSIFREAAVRWHLTWDHKTEDQVDESGASEEELVDDVDAGDDEDFTVEVKEKSTNLADKQMSGPKTQDYTVEVKEKSTNLADKQMSGPRTQEIVIVIENPPTAEKSSEEEKASVATASKALGKDSEVQKSEEERPFSCKICGRSFKEAS